MRIVFCVFLVIIAFLTVVDCQGGGGRKSSSSSRSSSRGWRSRPSHSHGVSMCTGADCLRQEAIACCKLVGIILVIVSIIFFYQWWKSRPIQSNETYVNLPASEIETQDLNEFESGFWSSRYYQYDAWHGPHRFSLLFDPETLKVTGSGSDDVGAYTIDGIYWTKTDRMGLTKTYQKGTGDLQQNLGHHVTIQMTWNSTRRQFEGKWFVKTNKYSGEGKFELKLEKGYKAIQ